MATVHEVKQFRLLPAVQKLLTLQPRVSTYCGAHPYGVYKFLVGEKPPQLPCLPDEVCKLFIGERTSCLLEGEKSGRY